MLRCSVCGARNELLERRIGELEHEIARMEPLVVEARALLGRFSPPARPALVLVGDDEPSDA